MNHVHMCKQCERVVVPKSGSEACPICGTPTFRLTRNTANNVLWKENMDRAVQYVRCGRILPKLPCDP
jgi:uncharacterized Zn finger protein (UPF0148 family)